MNIDPREIARQELAMLVARTDCDVSLIKAELLELIEGVALSCYHAGFQDAREEKAS